MLIGYITNQKTSLSRLGQLYVAKLKEVIARAGHELLS
jgi:hypothetical protein